MNQRTPPIRPEVWEQPAMRTALAERDIGRVYKLLTAAGISQHGIARLTQQSPSEVSEILSGRQVKQVDVLERICDGLGAERGWMQLADGSEHSAYPGEDEAVWEAVTEEMKRRDALALASMAVVGAPVLGKLLTLPVPAEVPLPSRLVMADVEAVQDLTARLWGLARAHGGQTDVLSHTATRCTRLLTVPAGSRSPGRSGAHWPGCTLKRGMPGSTPIRTTSPVTTSGKRWASPRMIPTGRWSPCATPGSSPRSGAIPTTP